MKWIIVLLQIVGIMRKTNFSSITSGLMKKVDEYNKYADDQRARKAKRIAERIKLDDRARKNGEEAEKAMQAVTVLKDILDIK